MTYEVNQNIGGNWENPWTDCDNEGNEKPQVFDTFEDAQETLDNFFHDIHTEILNGNLSENGGYDYNDFMIIETPELEYISIEIIAA